jgi:hypothetical protein
MYSECCLYALQLNSSKTMPDDDTGKSWMRSELGHSCPPHPTNTLKLGGHGTPQWLSPNKCFTFSNVFPSLTTPQPAPTFDPIPTHSFISTPTSKPHPDLPLHASTSLSKAFHHCHHHKELHVQSFSASHDTKHPNARQLLKFIGAVNSHLTCILIDGGAEGTIPIRYHRLLALQSLLYHPIVQQPYPITRHTLDAIVYPLSKYDLILSKPWLTAMNLRIN